MTVVSIERSTPPPVAMPITKGPVSRSGRSMSPRSAIAVVSAESNDSDLVDAIASGHEAALAEAYRRHGGSVFGLSSRLLGDRSMAEDVTQELFLRLWNEPHRFDPRRGALRSFLHREAHSRSIERIRSEEARRRREDRVHALESDTPTDLEASVIASIESQAVVTALSRLDPNDRRAIVLAYFGGLSYREVAVRLDQPEGTIKSRIRNGLRRLAVAIGEDGREDR